MSLRLVTDATAEPVSVADLKTFIGLGQSTEEDAFLTAIEKAARQYAENYTKRNCLPQTWQLKLDEFPDDDILLMRAPLSTDVTNVVITYLDPTSGDSTTLSSTSYTVDYDSEPGRIFLSASGDWPDVFDRKGAITIQFVAGFKCNTAVTPATDTCPEDIEAWIKMRTKAMYESRDSHGDRQVYEAPHSFIDGLLDRHVLIDVRP